MRTSVRYRERVASPAPILVPAPGPSPVELAGRVRPVVLAGERRLPVPGPLGGLLPGGGLQRGSVVTVEGVRGAGGTSLVLALVAAATASGEWAAIIDGEERLGGLAAVEAGVALERVAVVRGVPAERFGGVVAGLLEGVTLVVAAVPRRLRMADARRLAARARERGSVLVTTGAWPAEAALRLRAEGSVWSGLGRGEGLLGARTVRVTVAGRGAARTVDVSGALDRAAS